MNPATTEQPAPKGTADPKWEAIKNEIRQTDLLERLEAGHAIVSSMCKEGRPPKMSIPVRAADEDVFLGTTLEDATAELADLREAYSARLATHPYTSADLEVERAMAQQAREEAEGLRKLLWDVLGRMRKLSVHDVIRLDLIGICARIDAHLAATAAPARGEVAP